jgi:hypothetical protein
MDTRIQIRRDTTANWGIENPILAEGEFGLDTDLGKFKIGNGTDTWSILGFQEGSITTVTDNLTSTSTFEALSANQGKVLKTLVDAIPSETTTTLSINANVLTYTDETGVASTIDLSLYLDDTNLARIVSGVLGANNIATFTRDDTPPTTFTVDFSSLLSGKADTIHGTHLTTQDTTDIATGVAHAGSAHAPVGAEVNVQSDWNVTNAALDTFIANKPTSDIATGVAHAGSAHAPSDANYYVHPTGDSHLHVPATGATNDGKVLTAGATAGSLTWETPSAGGGASDLSSLTDVDVTTSTPTTNQVLKYDGLNWIPGDDVTGSGGTGGGGLTAETQAQIDDNELFSLIGL